MASLSSYYPQPVPIGTTSESVVVATGSSASRSLGDRFAESINVKDYGAVGDGVADDWLAIQRAIYDSTLAPESRTALSISATATSTTIGGRTILTLYSSGQGLCNVYFPQGTYRITKPLVIWQGINLIGQNSGGSRVSILNDSHAAGYQFPCITDRGILLAGDDSATTPLGSEYLFNYNHNCWITGLNFIGGNVDYLGPNGFPANQSGLIAPQYWWMKWPIEGIAGSWAVANGSSGASVLTTNYAFNYKQGGKIKLYPSGQILDIRYADGSNIYLQNPLASNVVNANYAFGYESHNGIWIAGGEGSLIENCWSNGFLGSGFFIFGGSPAPVIKNTMANFCDVGYRIMIAPCVLIKPSGDCNNQIIKCEGFTNTTLISGKFEDPRPATGPYPNNTFFVPYPNMTQVKPMFEVEGLPSGTPTFFSVNGCMQNGSLLSTVNQPFVKLWSTGIEPVVKLDGVRTLGANYRAFLEHYSYDGTLRETVGRDDVTGNNDERHVYLGASPYYSSTRSNGTWSSHQQLGTISETYHSVISAGSQLDIQNKETKRRSGRMPNLMRFTRSGTTATITYRNSADTANAAHGLVVGDSVYFKNYTFTSGTGSLAFSGNIRDGQYWPLFYIKSISDPLTSGGTDYTKFTIAVANSGATAGSANIWAQQYVSLHTVTFDEHQIQMPSDRGSIYTYDWTDPNNPITEYRAFTIYDRKKDAVASLAVPSANTGNWWVKQQFSAGGTIANPSIQILHGTNAPSASAPNGSIYLRTGGTADTTLYVRAGGAWTALTST